MKGSHHIVSTTASYHRSRIVIDQLSKNPSNADGKLTGLKITQRRSGHFEETPKGNVNIFPHIFFVLRTPFYSRGISDRIGIIHTIRTFVVSLVVHQSVCYNPQFKSDPHVLFCFFALLRSHSPPSMAVTALVYEPECYSLSLVAHLYRLRALPAVAAS